MNKSQKVRMFSEGRVAFRRVSVATLCLATMFCLQAKPMFAQSGGSLPKVHYLMDARQEPGAVARMQIARQAPGVGTFQALSISGPKGMEVALAKDGQFLPTLEAPVTTAMLVGAVYRFRVTGVPFRPGEELYPTVEVIDRIDAPAGREHRFPIPVVLTPEDLQSALAGALVTRVIYLEDSEVAEPIAAKLGEQRTTDVGPLDNALQTADQLGKPVAILRIGSRVPADLTGDLSAFLYGCPPWLPLPAVPSREQFVNSGQWPETIAVEPAEKPFPETPTQDYPRVPMQ